MYTNFSLFSHCKLYDFKHIDSCCFSFLIIIAFFSLTLLIFKFQFHCCCCCCTAYLSPTKQKNKQTNKKRNHAHCLFWFDWIGFDLILTFCFKSKRETINSIKTKHVWKERKWIQMQMHFLSSVCFDCSVVLLSQVFGNKTSKFIHFCSFFPIKI